MAKTTLLNIISLLVLVTGCRAIDDTCIACLCEFISYGTECNFMVGCQNGVCGPYGITMPFWIDAGSPTINGAVPSSSEYQQCAVDVKCAETTIRNYMTRYSQDCNGDGKVDCLDIAAIHANGPFGCRNPLRVGSTTALQNCLDRSNSITDGDSRDAEMIDVRLSKYQDY
ncbi:invertebrate-type lysozyme 3-like [Macrosteles quadrilineatus]|uniref:invertebrate-type lysozyme 3-like n=1 Tax=Macrosteles quadrilineatus TaxID=74068 RepID=UPI0023E0C8C8|nr:invertebrate-type lysozyme 3-like [Macrosteles quadrilineatus]